MHYSYAPTFLQEPKTSEVSAVLSLSENQDEKQEDVMKVSNKQSSKANTGIISEDKQEGVYMNAGSIPSSRIELTTPSGTYNVPLSITQIASNTAKIEATTKDAIIATLESGDKKDVSLPEK